jgi:hypothetical protein
MRMTDQLLLVARAYQRARSLSISRVSTLVFNDGKRLDSILVGGDLATARFEKAMRWFSENWPANAEWPDAVHRPAIAEASA